MAYAQLSVPGKFLDLNNIKAKVNADGSLFTDYSHAQFEAPKGGGSSTIFADNIWVGGIDAGSQLHMAGQTYRQTGTDFFPGPLDNTGTADTAAFWNNVWKLNKCDIDAYHAWVLGGQAGPVPVDSAALNEIMEWPVMDGTGAPLAPYFDFNGDAFYDPTVGDYPLIKGDQAIFFVFNDKGGPHTETGGMPIGLEIQGMAYEYNCPDSALYNTVFVSYKITNKSTNTFDNVYLGKWTDFDIGYYNDDYIGCDVARGAYYGYNGAGTDPQYGANPPAQAVVFLRGPYATPNFMADPADSTANGYGYGDTIVDNEQLGMDHFIAYYNNSSGTTGNPSAVDDYYDYMRSVWQDGTPLIYGGNGYGTGVRADYMYPGISDPTGFGTGGTVQAPWSEVTENNTPGDRRCVGAAGPFRLTPGSVEPLELAYVFGKANSGGNLASLAVMQERIDSVRAEYNRGITTCGCNATATGIPVNTNAAGLSLYPNPASEQLYVDYAVQSTSATLEIYDMKGACVKQLQINASPVRMIGINDLSKGLYMLRIVDGEHVATKKFLKE